MNSSKQIHDANQPVFYRIQIKGHLGEQWMGWFEGLTITLEEDGNTLLQGPVIDQAALYGLLRKVRDLGMPLLAVNLDERAVGRKAIQKSMTQKAQAETSASG